MSARIIPFAYEGQDVRFIRPRPAEQTSAENFRMTTMLMTSDQQSTVLLAQMRSRRYGLFVMVNPMTDLGRSTIVRRTSAHHPIAGAFFASAQSFYGGCAWDTFGCAGCLTSRSANPRTAATHPRLAAKSGSSSTLGATPMKHAIIPSAIRAFAHRRMALSALRANLSLSSRLARYNANMAIVRTLENAGGAK